DASLPPKEAASFRRQVVFWAGAFAVLSGFLWLFSDVLTPFVLGAAIAYLLNPVLNRTSGGKFPRWAAAVIVLTLFLVFVLVMLAAVLPFAYRELNQLVENLPGFIDRAQAYFRPWQDWMQRQL